MATTILIPTSNGGYNTWSPSSGANWQCVDETVADEDTTRVINAAGSGASYQTFGHSQTLVGQVLDVAITVRAKSSVAGTFMFHFLYDTVNSSGDLGGGVPLTTSYTNYTANFATNPVTGLAWTISEVNGLQMGMVAAVSSGAAYVTQVYTTVTLADQSIGTATLVLPNLVAAITGKTKLVASSVLRLPKLRALATGPGRTDGSAIMTLPSLSISSLGSVPIPINSNLIPAGSPRRLHRPGRRM